MWRLVAVRRVGLHPRVRLSHKNFLLRDDFCIPSDCMAGHRKSTKDAQASSSRFVVFALVAGPWIAALSRAKNRITFGDVGKLSSAMMIDQIPQPFFWQGEDATGTPKHPVRQLLSNPRLYEFATPVGGTYPPAYDTSYWMEGVRPHFSLRASLGFSANLLERTFRSGCFSSNSALVCSSFHPCLSKAEWKVRLFQQSYLWIPPLIGCSAYAIVLVEHRYVAPFVLILWIAAFSCLLSTPLEISRVSRSLSFSLSF